MKARAIQKYSYVAAAVFLFSSASHAGPAAVQSFSPHCPGWLQLAAGPSFEEAVEQMYVNYRDNLSIRGFATSRYPRTKENMEIAASKYGFIWWYTQVYFVKSREAALEHAKQFSRAIQDNFSVGLYVIADESELEVAHSAGGTLVPALNIQRIFSRGAIEIDYLDPSGARLEEPHVRDISGTELLSRIDLGLQADPKLGISYVTGHDRSYGSNYLNLWGWHTGKFRGLIDHEEFLASRRNRELWSLARKLYLEGYRVIFNPTDPRVRDEAFEVLKNTQRMKRVQQADGTVVEVKLPLSINRHRIVGVDHLQTENSYLAVVLDPQGRVVGGEAGVDMEGETIFYHPELSANLPELTTASQLSTAFTVLVAYQRMGLKYTSAGPMVSNFSENMHTDAVPLPEALRRLAQNPKPPYPRIDDLVWNPFEGTVSDEIDGIKFGEIVRKIGDQELTTERFASSVPLRTPSTIRVAAKAEYGLEPTQIFFEIVDSVQTARARAAAHPNRATTTIFLVTDLAIDRTVDSLELLKNLMASGLPSIPDQRRRQPNGTSGLKMAFSFKDPEGRNLRFYDHRMLSSRLKLDQGPATTYLDNSDRSVIVVPGWKPTPR